MPGLTTFQIKLLAAMLMVIDHAGRLLFDDNLFMIAIGRLSFPLFAWLAGQGERHTSNLRNYILRLLGVGLLTQPIYLSFITQVWPLPFDWPLPFPYWFVQWNMLFALAYGVWMIRCIKQQTALGSKIILAILMAIVAQLLKLEGGLITSLSIYAMSLLNQSPIVGYGLFAATYLLYLPASDGFNVEFIALLAPLICLRYNGEQGRAPRWFYSFYPLHFAGLLALKLYLLPQWFPQMSQI